MSIVPIKYNIVTWLREMSHMSATSHFEFSVKITCPFEMLQIDPNPISIGCLVVELLKFFKMQKQWKCKKLLPLKPVTQNQYSRHQTYFPWSSHSLMKITCNCIIYFYTVCQWNLFACCINIERSNKINKQTNICIFHILLCSVCCC